MQRIVTAAVSLVIVLAVGINLLLFTQNQDLRRRLATQPAPTTPAAAPQSKLDALNAELDRYKQDYNKAMTEARGLREQNGKLNGAASERDKLKTEVNGLRQENSQLKNEVQNLQTMNGINDQVTALRGLPPKKVVPRSFMNQNQLREYFTKSFEQTYSDANEADDTAALGALDMGGGGASGDYRKQQIEALTKSVLGFYDHETKNLVVVTNRPRMGVRDRVTYAHEFTHSLQDQYYDLNKLFASAKGNSDHEMAIRALVEGDATVSMSLYAQKYLSALDIANYKLESIADLDPYSLLSGGGPLIESASYFPYQEGAAFVQGLYAGGGYAEVDQAFANPPRSTEQIIHPEKYINGDEPVALSMPNLSDALGWRLVQDDTLGELYIRIYLEHALSFEQAIPAGEGWGGDHYQVLQNSKKQTALALRTAWDTIGDAQEFFETYKQYVLTIGGTSTSIVASGDTQMRWQLGDRQVLLARSGNQVLVLHAPDGGVLDTMAAQF